VAGDRYRLLARGEQEGVRVRDQIDEVVCMDVREDDRIDLGVVASLAQLREDPVAAIEQQPRRPLLDQVPATGAAGVLPRRRLAEHRDPHRDRDSTRSDFRNGRKHGFGSESKSRRFA